MLEQYKYSCQFQCDLEDIKFILKIILDKKECEVNHIVNKTFLESRKTTADFFDLLNRDLQILRTNNSKWSFGIKRGLIVVTNVIIFHNPQDLIEFKQKYYGSSEALNTLKPIMHERIDQIFNSHKF